MKKKLFFRASLLLAVSFILMTKSYSQNNTAVPVYVIEKVNVIPMTSPNQVIKNASVVIHGNRIESVNGLIPENAMVINGKDKWLIPGLTDMHVHLPADLNTSSKNLLQSPDIVFDVQDIMTPFVANGITTVFNLNANMESFYQRKLIQSGKVIGPHILLAALIDGGEGSGRRAHTAAEGAQAVRDAKAEGYHYIKLYSGLNTATYTAIIQEAFRQEMKTVGHIPNVFRDNLKKAFIPHFNMVAHAEEFSKSAKKFTYEEARHFARLAKKNGSWVTPTLTAMNWVADQTHSLNSLQSLPTLSYIHPLLQSKWLTANNNFKNSTPEKTAYFDKIVAFQPLLVSAFKEAGVPIVAGTDSGISGVVAGFSLHDELELLVKAGLTTEEALDAATRLPALWLGIDKEVGTIEAGKLADLILLDKNPLEDISNTRKIAGVFINGKWLTRFQLDEMLTVLSNKNTSSKNQFDWKTIMNN